MLASEAWTPYLRCIVATNASQKARSSSHEVVKRLRDYIYGRNLVPPARLPSGRDLAAELGFDFSTLNRALRQMITRGVLRREGYKLFISRMPDENPTLSPIHVLCSHPKTITAAAEIAVLYNSKVIPLSWEWRSHRAEIRRLLASGNRDGLLVSTHVATPVDDLLQEFVSKGIPIVAVGHGSQSASAVQMDMEAAGREAVIHLAEMGHREMACFALREDGESIVRGYRRGCQELNFTDSAARVTEINLQPAAIRECMSNFRVSHPQVTGVFFTSTLLTGNMVEFGRLSASIPRKSSVVAYGDADASRGFDPPLTVLAEDPFRMGKYAATLLFGQKLELLKSGVLPKPERLFIYPKLIIRASTSAPASVTKKQVQSSPRKQASAAKHKWPSALAERKAEAQQIWQTPYTVASRSRTRDFKPLDLRCHASQGLTRFKSWIGLQPLLHMEPGRAKIHGVPFRIINEKTNKGYSAIVLKSPHARDPRFASQVQIGINTKVSAIYFLHGCGWAVDHTKCAEYMMKYADGSASSVALVPYGDGPSNLALRDQWQAESNIQDWWPTFPHFSNEHSRHLVVTKDGDPEAYERYLYTLEWVNPHPEKLLDHILIETNPHVLFTLGVLAITLLRPHHTAA